MMDYRVIEDSEYAEGLRRQCAAVVVGAQEALGMGGVIMREMQVLRRRVLAQGVAVIKRKYVVDGFVLTKADTRHLHLSKSGVIGAGVSRAAIDGVVVALPDDDYHVAVPANVTEAAIQFTAYLIKVGGSYVIQIGQVVPDQAMPVYRVTVPSGDAGASLAAVTLADLRVIQPLNSWVVTFDAFVSVAFAEALPAADYAVELEVESATDPAAVGTLVVYDKAKNGFKIRQTGSADNVRIRWTLLNPRYQ